MYRAIVVILCVVPFVLFPQFGSAAEDVLTDCDVGITFMEDGSIVDCAIEFVGDSDLFRFSGTAGHTILLTLTDGDCNSPHPEAQLFDPDNEPIEPILFPGNCTGTVLQVTLLKTGRYTVLVSESGNDQVVPYRIALERLFPPSPNTVHTVFPEPGEPEEPISDQLDPAPDNDFFSFNAIQGAVVRVTLTDGDCNSPHPEAQLFDPDNELIEPILSPGNCTGTFLQVALPKTGTYLVRVHESGNDQRVPYSLAIACIFPPPGSDRCDEPPVCGGLEATIIGTNEGETIRGTGGNDVIVGLGGNDVIYGLGGDDVICGGPGNDTILGGGGNDRIFGNSGSDALFGEGGDDVLSGGSGRDSLFGGRGNDRLFGNGEDDLLFGGAGNDRLNGGNGTDICDDTEDLNPAQGCEITL